MTENTPPDTTVPATPSTDATHAQDPIALLDTRFRDALAAAFGEEFRKRDPLIKSTQDAKFGDFQVNAAMSLAKAVGKSPREIAQLIADAVQLDDLCELPLTIAGPGFINLTIKSETLIRCLEQMDTDALGLEPMDEQASHRVAVDMVGVNVAKQMHVGHLRSSIIGDTLCRILNRVGYDAVPQNHLGDWGLQIAMVLTDLRNRQVDLDTFTIDELERAYRSSNLDCKADRAALETSNRLDLGPHRISECEEQVAGADAALKAAKNTLVLLQQGDPDVVSDWQKIIQITLQDCYDICAMLGLQLTEDHERGESFYRDMLPVVIREFEDSGIAEVDDGALLVRIPDSETPLLIRKSDGGFLYATTDLAGVKYRVQEFGAERLVYVVDARQRDHFKLVFAACHMIGYDIIPEGVPNAGNRAEVKHVPFGAVCGDDGRPLKTRSGENVKLRDLLEEAVRRAGEIVSEKNPELSDEERTEVAQAVGIGAVKYADLSSHLGRDYVFNWDRMLAFEGNTGAYLQNQYVRIRSINRKAPADAADDQSAAITLDEPQEKALAMVLLRYPTVVRNVADTLEPHRLCQYLYDVAQAFSVFYTNCSVLKADSDALRDSRLRLCRLTASVLGDGLSLLGIKTLERM